MSDRVDLILHRAGCGCAGVRLDETSLLVLDACDGDTALSFFTRRVDTPLVPLDGEAAASIVAGIQRLMADGNRFRDLRRLLAD